MELGIGSAQQFGEKVGARALGSSTTPNRPTPTSRGSDTEHEADMPEYEHSTGIVKGSEISFF